jgi:hypothetical protein
MAAPQFVPVDPVDRPRSYESPAYVPAPWSAERPAGISGRQPVGTRLGFPGPDQGYALLLAERVRPRVQVSSGESVDDALAGCLGVALRRAALYGRAPVIHDLTIALTVWGFFDPNPPADLLALRRTRFAGVAHLAHHYAEAREIAENVPESVLKMTPSEVQQQFPSRWREFVGATET